MKTTSISKAMDFFAAEYPDISSDYLVITDNGIAGFSKISGMTLRSNQYRTFTEGGQKGVHILAEQDKQFNTMTLEKGVGGKDLTMALGPLRTLIVVSISKAKLPKRAYAVLGAVLQKIAVSDFNAESSALLINSATVAYSKIVSMPLSGIVDGFPSSAVTAASAAFGGISGAAKEAGMAVKNVENGLLETIKSVNAEADKLRADKLLRESEEKFGELDFWK